MLTTWGILVKATKLQLTIYRSHLLWISEYSNFWYLRTLFWLFLSHVPSHKGKGNELSSQCQLSTLFSMYFSNKNAGRYSNQSNHIMYFPFHKGFNIPPNLLTTADDITYDYSNNVMTFKISLANEKYPNVPSKLTWLCFEIFSIML